MDMNLVGMLFNPTLQLSGDVSIPLGETLGRRKAEGNLLGEGTCTYKAGAAQRMGKHVVPSVFRG